MRWRLVGIGVFLLVVGMAVPGMAEWEVRSAGGGRVVGLKLSADGTVTGVRLGEQAAYRPVLGETRLAGCRPEGVGKAKRLNGGGVEIERSFRLEGGPKAGRRATVVERFTPQAESVRWELEVRGHGEPWSVPIETHFRVLRSESSMFWTAWGDPRPEGKDWTDPLRPAKWEDREFFYGGRYKKFFKEPGTFSLPLATIVEEGRDEGMSLVLSPEDVMLGLKMRTTREGEVTFSREYHRLEEGKVVRCAMDLVAHAADWRGGVAFMSGQYPAYFESPNAGVQLLSGCGSYSSHAKVEDAERLMRMAYRVNWQASFDFPYMGMFIPPVSSEDESWIDFKEQPTSIGKIRSMVQSLRGRGFDTLSYFNVTEFGARTKYPAPARKAATDAELWHDSNDFLHYALGGAILPGADGKPIFSWEGCVVMDAGEKVYQDFLVEQARRHIERVPESAGIAIDRMDWLMEYNTQRDDGVSWHGDRPARALTQSWKQLMERLSPVFHDAGKVIFVNPMAARIDLMRSVDAFYDEHGQHPHSLNTCTLLALNKPYVAWTWELEEFDKNPDAYFQRHLHLGAFLTAPVPGNDHTILPDAKRDKFYCDYGPLLDTLRGKRWALLPHAVRVEGSKTLANLFEVPGGYVVPVTFGGEAAAADVVVRTPTNDPAQGRYRAWAIHPGANQPAKLSAETNPDGMKVSVPLVRGCAMLVLVHTWMSPSVRNFHDTAEVKLGTVLESGELRYTLDGSEPTAESPLYSESIKLSKTTLVRAAAFQKGQRVGRVLEREYVKLEGGKGEL